MPKPLPLHLAFVFHCNQAISPFAQVAAENCYRGLVRVLKRHPRSGFNFHWSGSLLATLNWFYPELVQSIRKELAKGRWEVLASTFAQNVPFTGPRSLNQVALGVHRAILKSALPEFTPRGYWISERSWRPGMEKEIAAAGLEYTLIEDHMLADAGCDDLHRPRRIGAGGGRELVVFTDNEDFKHRVNAAIWTGNVAPVLEYLDAVREATGDSALPPIVTYAEDGEASGLWPAERGCPPQIAWEHLDLLLTALERDKRVRLTRLSDYLDAHRGAIPRESRRLVAGQARWMCASLRDRHLPYHEDGYTDWFDFNRRAEKIKRFRPLFHRAARDVIESETESAPARRLSLHGAMNVAAHTFEFGCIGIGSRRARLWERHRTARLPLALIEAAEQWRSNGSPQSFAHDLNADQRREHVLIHGGVMSVWSKRTGVLLYLFHLPSGDELAGNELAASGIFGQGYDDDIIPECRPSEPVWSGFRSGRQRLADFRGLWKRVPRDQSWLRWLLDWKALGEHTPNVKQVVMAREHYWRLENGRRKATEIRMPERLRQRSLVERMAVDGRGVLDIAAISRAQGRPLRFRALDEGFELAIKTDDVSLTKRVTARASGLEVEYEVRNRNCRAHEVTLNVDSEWAPSYMTLVLFGRRTVEVTPQGARNILTGAEVKFELDVAAPRAAVARETEATLLALHDRRTVRLPLAAGSTARVRGVLTVTPGTRFEHLDEIAREWKGLCGVESSVLR